MTERVRRLWRLAARQHWVVGIRQLHALGFTRDAIRHLITEGRLFPLHRGVHAVGRPRPPLKGVWLSAVIALSPRALVLPRAVKG